MPTYAQHNQQFFIVDCDVHDCVVNKYIYWTERNGDVSLKVWGLCCFNILLYKSIGYYQQTGARGGAVGWGTALQAGRSWVRFPMVSFEFFIDIILSAAL